MRKLLTLDTDRDHQDNGHNKQEDVLHLTPRRLAEVGFAVVANVTYAVHVLLLRLGVEPRQDRVQLLGDVLTGLLLEE